jgi:hypothetical protein
MLGDQKQEENIAETTRKEALEFRKFATSGANLKGFNSAQRRGKAPGTTGARLRPGFDSQQNQGLSRA